MVITLELANILINCLVTSIKTTFPLCMGNIRLFGKEKYLICLLLPAIRIGLGASRSLGLMASNPRALGKGNDLPLLPVYLMDVNPGSERAFIKHINESCTSILNLNNHQLEN